MNSLSCKSFQRKSDEEERLILNKGRETPNLTCIQIGKYINRTFKISWYEKYKWVSDSEKTEGRIDDPGG